MNINVENSTSIVGLEYSKVLCSICDENYKLVKRPIKRQLTKKEKVEIVLFFIVGMTFVIAAVVWIAYSLIVDVKEGKGWDKTILWNFLIAIVISVAFKLWFERVERLSKEDKDNWWR